MLADKAGLQGIPGDEGEDGGAATGGIAISLRRSGQTLQPDLTVMRDLRGQSIRPEERMGKPPSASFELAQGLGQPAGQREVIEVMERPTVFTPE